MENDFFKDFGVKRIKSNIDYFIEEELIKFISLYYDRRLFECLE